MENREFRPLSDKENIKYNASKEADTFKKIFNLDGMKEKISKIKNLKNNTKGGGKG
jgi:hypothetical protein